MTFARHSRPSGNKHATVAAARRINLQRTRHTEKRSVPLKAVAPAMRHLPPCMGDRGSGRLLPAEGRRFGLAVGAAFVALAGLAAWRGHTIEARGFAGVGGALVAAALLVPTRLGPIQRSWMALARTISTVTTPLLLGVIYFGIVTPVGWLRRLAGANRLARSRATTSYWVAREESGPRHVRMEHQF